VEYTAALRRKREPQGHLFMCLHLVDN
jgi:hypothetical protein